MKKNLLLVFTLIALATSSFAQSRLIHYWNFNNYTLDQYTDTIRGIKANYSILDTNKAQILYAKQAGTSAVYSTHLDAYAPPAAELDTFNAQFGDTAGNALRVRNPSDSMQLMFYMPTTHYKNIVLKYGSERSNNGQLEQAFDYSVDSGITWKTVGLSIMSDSPTAALFKLTTVSFSDTTVNNNSKFVFRIKFNGNNTGTSGNNRFDNVTLKGDSIIVSTSVANINAENEVSVYPNPTSSNIHIGGNNLANSTISLYDVTGKKLEEKVASTNEEIISLDNYASGIYFVKITNNNGSSSNYRVIKQ